MATQKTVLSIKADDDQFQVQYSGGFEPDWNNLTPKERKSVLRHDNRIVRVLLSCPLAFKRIADFVHAVERYQRREAKKAAKSK